MEHREKDCIEYALHIYDTFWDYYKKTLDERNQIINSYMVFVGIPITIVGLFTDNIISNINNYNYWIMLVLVIILILGIVIFNAYIVESFISEKYLKRIKLITDYLQENFDSSYKKVFSKLYTLNDLFLNSKASQRHRLGKSSIIIVGNTALVVGIFCLTQKFVFRWYNIILSVFFSGFIHMCIFLYQKRANQY